MKIFKKIVELITGGNSTSFDKPPIYGGDGKSQENAVVINCASIGMANSLINRFLSEKYGVLDKDWKRSVEFYIHTENNNSPKIRVIGIETTDETKIQYFFDLSRPMKALDKMMGLH